MDIKTDPTKGSRATDSRENWYERPARNGNCAAFHFGRLLSCFAFHLRQTAMLYAAEMMNEMRSQRDASRHALDNMKALAPLLNLDRRTAVERAVDEAKESSINGDSFSEFVANLRDDYNIYGEDHPMESWRRDVVEKYAEPIIGSLRRALLDLCSDVQRPLLALGQCLEEGIRPATIYNRMFERPKFAADADEEPSGEEYVGDSVEVEIIGNSFANRCRAAGELAPDAAWYHALRSQLMAAGVEIDLPSDQTPPTHASVCDLVDKVDMRIRETLPEPLTVAGRPFSLLQQRIWKALDGKALKKDALAKKVCSDQGSRLYRPQGIKELKNANLIGNQRGTGYFRFDAPPPGLNVF